MNKLVNRSLKLPRELELSWMKALVMFGKNQRDPELFSQAELKRLAMRSASLSMPNIEKLWETFTQERSGLVKNLLAGREKTHAYLAGFHLVNQFKTWAILERMMIRTPALGKTLKSKHIQVVDLGCGSGAAGIGAAHWLAKNVSPNQVRIEGVDSSNSLLETAAYMSKDLGIEFVGHRGFIETQNVSLQLDHPIVLCLGYVWNEIYKNKAAKARLFKIMGDIAKSKSPSLIIILDPSDELGAKSAMKLREELREKELVPIYPCPSAKPCPLLESGRDWCYSELAWEKPVLQRKIEESLGISRTVLGVSGFVYANAAMARKIHVLENQKVVIGRPTTKDAPWGHFNYLLCTDTEVAKIPGSAHPLLKGTLYEA
jgi:SAM-dependent methyltransferase